MLRPRSPRRPSQPLALAAAFARAVCITVAFADGARAAVLEVMSFNIRYDNGLSTLFDPNGWLYGCGPRRDRVSYVIQEANPDILGVQEALINQVNDLKAALPGHGFYGVGRNDGVNAGEFSGLFYRSSRFTRFAQGTFWLSDTPDVPGTVFPCSGSIRIASWAKLHDAASGLDYFVLNTHWDNACQDSRVKSAALVRQKIGELSGGLPVIAMGDLNATESNVAVTALEGVSDPTELQLGDAYREVFPTPAPNEATFHDFTGNTSGSRIDYVMHTSDFGADGASIVHTGFGCGWPSDHFPVTATLEVTGGASSNGTRVANPPSSALTDPCVPHCTGCGSAAPTTSKQPARGTTGAAAAIAGLFAILSTRRRSSGSMARSPAVALVLVLAGASVTGCHTVDSVEPPQGCPGNVVRIHGSGLGFIQDTSRVLFGDVETDRVSFWSNDFVDVVVPEGVSSAPVKVVVNGETAAASGAFAVVSGLACRGSLIAGPAEYGYDADLEALARKYDRQFHTFNALPMGVNADLGVALDRVADRELIRSFLQDTDGWDFDAFAGKSAYDTVTGWSKVAGLYAGAGISADAFRYGVLRDQGYPAAEVARARQHLLDGLEALHRAMAITGVEGVIARGFIRRDIPGDGVTQPTTPLFDESGQPLPIEKNNGTWREDHSGGLYTNYIWEDSCSRDMLDGWAAAFGAAWEVIADDPTVSNEVRIRLQDDARALGRMMSTVQASGFDLEIQDADGRPTFHAYLNEQSYDRYYLPFLPFKNGMHTTMSLGIMSSLVYTSGDPELTRYLADQLLGARRFSDIVAANELGVDFGNETNYSNVNMAFQGMLMAQRYVSGDEARANLISGLRWKLYAKPWPRQPSEQKSSFFDFIYAAGVADSSATHAMRNFADRTALARGLESLKAFPTPPFWDSARTNCDADEVASGVCLADDGTHLDLLGYLGRGDTLIASQPIPMRIRPPSNYFWRSNPYEPNGGGDGTRLLPGVDFRYAYWYGRWVR